jgi:hypothetical protein
MDPEGAGDAGEICFVSAVPPGDRCRSLLEGRGFW